MNVAGSGSGRRTSSDSMGSEPAVSVSSANSMSDRRRSSAIVVEDGDEEGPLVANFEIGDRGGQPPPPSPAVRHRLIPVLA